VDERGLEREAVSHERPMKIPIPRVLRENGISLSVTQDTGAVEIETPEGRFILSVPDVEALIDALARAKALARKPIAGP
jgi:hypothetical protein